MIPPCRHLHVVRYLVLDDLTGGYWLEEAKCYDCNGKWRRSRGEGNQTAAHEDVLGFPVTSPPKPTPEPPLPRKGYRSPPGTRPPPPRFPKKR